MKLKLTPFKYQTIYVRRICLFIRYCELAYTKIETGLGKYNIVLRAIQLNPNKRFVLIVKQNTFDQVMSLLLKHNIKNARLISNSVTIGLTGEIVFDAQFDIVKMYKR